MKIGLGPAGQVEWLLKFPSISMQIAPLDPEDHDALILSGCIHSIALRSGWLIKQEMQMQDYFGDGRGRGIRAYNSGVTIEVPTESDSPFIVTFDMSFNLYFAEREARSEEKNWLFNGKEYPFRRKMQREPTIWDYMYSVGCPLAEVERRISVRDAAVIRRARTEWLQKFQPGRLTGASVAQ